MDNEVAEYGAVYFIITSGRGLIQSGSELVVHVKFGHHAFLPVGGLAADFEAVHKRYHSNNPDFLLYMNVHKLPKNSDVNKTSYATTLEKELLKEYGKKVEGTEWYTLSPTKYESKFYEDLQEAQRKFGSDDPKGEPEKFDQKVMDEWKGAFKKLLKDYCT